ncbi:hypothetical protein Lqui_2800 [Legionella quinlivanii]|uniref:Uncharacterized protein n=1 Tax=Legionella quinlivanii TaxID=45073 RepID=A0A0W0XKX8_9GAMM|nr:hypothetical protein [Legionella quinlivanii]KTD45329.1 hypothetical protein Lqui_2800 [Legionella quinlivanii]SEG15892.1 hypothetical protein SAMN02746093_02033 [Legionella quinlivanii DSM 21216]STY10415.1 Uncharacterised protein [Legionella quinlivanii]
MKSSQGMILIVFSLILNFIALLVMAQSESLFLFYKNLGQMIHIQSEIQFLEEEAIRLLKQKKSTCTVFNQGANEILHQLQSRSACCIRHEEQKYCYLLEDLGEFPCLRIKNKYKSHQWRITLSNDQLRPFIMQIRYAEATGSQQCLENQFRVIEEGVQSFRIL